MILRSLANLLSAAPEQLAARSTATGAASTAKVSSLSDGSRGRLWRLLPFVSGDATDGRSSATSDRAGVAAIVATSMLKGRRGSQWRLD